MTEWKIGKGAASCQACGGAFAEGQAFFSALEEGQAEEEWRRFDFCPACWPVPGRTFFSFWRTSRPPAGAEVRFVRRASLSDCFFDLCATGEGAKRPRLLYVLALLLVRLRVLRLLGVERAAGGDRLRLRRAGGDEEYRIADPALALGELEGLLAEVNGLFAGEAPAAAAAAPGEEAR